MIPIDEIFGPTLQGEGPMAGRVSLFVRVAGCDYRCKWCDTKYAWTEEGKREMETQEVMVELSKLRPARLVTITGGNPALYDLEELCNRLRQENRSVCVETQGSIPRDWFGKARHLVISPKPPSSGNMTPGNLVAESLSKAGPMTRAYLKLAVEADSLADWAYAQKIRKKFPSTPFYLQPVLGKGQDPWQEYAKLVRDVLQHGVLTGDWPFADATVLPQLHVMLWGGRRGV